MRSVAAGLLDGLTAALGVEFTLTDDLGVVVASTCARLQGRIEPLAAVVLRAGVELESAGKSAESLEGAATQREIAAGVPAGGAGIEPGVYHPVHAESHLDGVLIAHGTPDAVRTAARSAAASVGLALELARVAARSARQGPAGDVALHQLLRGSLSDARRAALVARVAGWDLTLPRIAMIVVTGGEQSSRALDPEHYTMITDFVDTVAPGTPISRMHPEEWVLLPELPSQTLRPAPRQLAEDLLAALRDVGAAVAIGLGEPYAEQSLRALRRSYREARYAARWGKRLRGPGGVYQLRDLGAVGFLALGRTTRRRLAARILQPLRSEPEVLDSVRAFLGCDCSIAAAANKAGVHRHTIRNHLDRVRDLIGLDPRSLDDAFQLHLALLLERRRA